MNKIIPCLMICVGLWAPVAIADVELLPIVIDIQDKEKLQRGAKIFMNYCSGCHSLRYMRYNRMAKDLGLTTFTGDVDNNLLVNNLLFTSAKTHDPIENSMPAIDARQWFGRVPPDLSLSARERGPEWIYTYLKSFYADQNRPFGANNALVPDVSMPNILAPLEGYVIAEQQKGLLNHQLPLRLVLVEQGEMSQQQFDSTLQDLVTFLVYVAEPVQLIRYRIGVGVMFFLSLFLIVAYQLKRFYWRDIS
jgi:ubiquinol-cytochrome c reductase cytochrome c1 subunit